MKPTPKPKTFWIGLAEAADDVWFLVLSRDKPEGRFCVVGNLSFRAATPEQLDSTLTTIKKLLLRPEFGTIRRKKRQAGKSRRPASKPGAARDEEGNDPQIPMDASLKLPRPHKVT